MKNKYISWRRVSTFKQSRSGLGLEAQKEIIRYFVEREGGDLIADYSECYTGTELSGCVELRKAMEHCKKEGAILVIAKSDRFRNTIEALQVYEEMGDGNIMFCDLPHTDKFTLTLFFALAEREALIVSIRTKQALGAKKARGEKLGGACEKWRKAYNKKTYKEKVEEQMKRGRTKNMRHLESADIKAFVRILKNIFVDETANDDMTLWNWKNINTKFGNRQRILAMMKDYQEIDKTLFRHWVIDDVESAKLQVKLASYIGSLRKSILRNKTSERVELSIA
jgi:DNA invertase Pin-like site-specific DNA recombinase